MLKNVFWGLSLCTGDSTFQPPPSNTALAVGPWEWGTLGMVDQYLTVAFTLIELSFGQYSIVCHTDPLSNYTGITIPY